MTRRSPTPAKKPATTKAVKASARKQPAPVVPKRTSRAEDLRADYDQLGRLLAQAEGSAAAAIARERRIISELLERLETETEQVPLVDQLAARRQARAGDAGPASRRRKPG